MKSVPGQAAIRFNLGVALYKSARIPEARTELARVVEQEPQNRNAVLLLADCDLQMGDDAAVIARLSPREEELRNERLFSYLLGTALIRRNELLRGQSYIDRLFSDGETAEGRLLIGATHLERRDGVAAIQEFERAIQLNPALPTVQSLYGRALLLTGRAIEAAAAFRRELETNPNDFDANLQLGLLLKDENKLDESYEHLTRAGRLRSQDPAVLYALGALHLAAGRVEEAQQALERVTRSVPNYEQAHVLLATAYYRQKKKELGDRHRAIAAKLAAEQQSREPGAAENLGAAYKGEAPAAASPPAAPKPADRSKDAKPAPTSSLDAQVRTVVERAHVLNQGGNHDAAFELLRGLANKGEDSQPVIEAFGLAVLRLPQAPDAVPAEKWEMIRLAGRGAYQMARVRRTSLGRLAFEELVSRYPSEPNVHFAFGNYLLPEEPDAAIVEFQKELRRSPEYYPALFQLAVAQTTKGNASEAVVLAEKGVQLAPDAPAGRLVLGRALLEAGTIDRAIVELEQAAKLAPDNPGIFFSLARAYRRADRDADAARARAEFQRLDRSAGRPAERRLVWSDEFDKPGLPDAARWGYDVGGEGWGNQELQFYTRERRENARVENGSLVIDARREPWEKRSYTSARLVTKAKGDWTYGRIEVRARLPKGRGTWPAIWMLATTIAPMKWPDDGEIDIMEHVGFDPGVIHASAHTKSYYHSIGTQKTAKIDVPDAMDAFHIYAIEWDASRIRWFVDEREYFSFAKEPGGKNVWPFDGPFHLILNVAVGGSWGGQKGVDETVFPARMEVDYVRVYQ